MLLISHLTLVVLSLGGLGLWTGWRLQVTTEAQAERQLRQQTALIAVAFRDPLAQSSRGPDEADLANEAREYAASTGLHVTVLDTQLRVLASSDEQATRSVTALEPEVLAVQRGQTRLARRVTGPRGEERLFVAAPVRNQTQVLGYVQCSAPTAPIRAAITRHWFGLLAVEVILLVAAVVVSVALARRIAAPVLRLTMSTRAIAAGHVEQRVIPAGPDEVRRLGQAFNGMAAQIQAALARQQTFVADAAHELRSPLAGIRLRLELLQTEPRDDALARRYLDQIEREVDQLRRLVDDLLTLSALDDERRHARSTVDLAPLLYDLADDVYPLAHAAGLDLRLAVPAHLPPLAGDPAQLRIVARNLLDNAIKYSPAGGALMLSAGATGKMVWLVVADTGAGIPAESLPHLFERFYRVDKARARHQGGVGLGLALVRAIVQAHGGSVAVESAPGAGSAFTVRLPVAPMSDAITVTASQRDRAGAGQRALSRRFTP
ncbi:MAG: sensor histidine kinase [Thermomicrobiales bacterium]